MTELSGFGLGFVACCCIGMLVLPRRLALVPLFATALFLPLNQGVLVGPYNFYAIRIVLAVGMLRLLLRGERPAGGLQSIDGWMFAMSAWTIASSLLRVDASTAFTYAAGSVFNALGTYLIFRAFIDSAEAVTATCRIVAWMLVPVAVEMVLEHATQRNYFSVLGGGVMVPAVREGGVRAQGAFGHAILAGTVGAAFLPLCAPLWRRFRASAIVGVCACAAMVAACSSSGPLLSSLFAVIALGTFGLRAHMRKVRYLLLAAYLALDLVMKVPAYYLLARIDLAGGSTGWHRAALIQASLDHFGEWWVCGTDTTRHWMASGVGWSTHHTDITNHYIALGVLGGLPLLLLFVALLTRGFSLAGSAANRCDAAMVDAQPALAWALGSALFVHAASLVSVSYFDQSFVMLYFVLACIAVSCRAVADDSATLLDPPRARDASPGDGDTAGTAIGTLNGLRPQ